MFYFWSFALAGLLPCILLTAAIICSPSNEGRPIRGLIGVNIACYFCFLSLCTFQIGLRTTLILYKTDLDAIAEDVLAGKYTASAVQVGPIRIIGVRRMNQNMCYIWTARTWSGHTGLMYSRVPQPEKPPELFASSKLNQTWSVVMED